MTKKEIRDGLYEVIKKDYESFIETVKKNDNYDFFRSLDCFAQKIAFLKSNESHGLNYYRKYIYNFIYKDKAKKFTFDALDRATKLEYYYLYKSPEQLLSENKILMYADNYTREEILGKTAYKDFKVSVEARVKSNVSDLINAVMFSRKY